MEEGLLPPIVGVLRANISEFKEKMAEARHEVAKTKTAAEKRMSIGGGLAAAGAAATGIGLAFDHVAKKQEEASLRLEVAIKNTGSSYEEYAGQVSKAVKQEERYGQTSDQTKTSLAGLTAVTQDPQKAFHLLGVAQEIAAAKGISLEDASSKVVKEVERLL